MFTKSILTAAAALLAATATADTAPGFPIRTTSNLTVTYGNNTVSSGGELIPRNETALPPTISSSIWYADPRTNSGPALLLMIDLDVPRNNTRVPLLHWLATNVTRPSPLSANTSDAALLIPSDPEVSYLQPSPPVGDIPHAYTFILLAQPWNFTLPTQYRALEESRVGFNVSEFSEATGLDFGIAATWITVQNRTGNPGNTSAYPPPREVPDEPTPGGGAVSGDAGRLARTGWVGIATVVLAGVFAVAL